MPLQVDGPPVHFTLYEISGSFSPFQSEPNLLEKNTASIFLCPKQFLFPNQSSKHVYIGRV
jgi:hypothetical protein